MRFTELKLLNTCLNPLAPPPATPTMHPHCPGDPPPLNDHQVQHVLKYDLYNNGDLYLFKDFDHNTNERLSSDHTHQA